MEKDASGVAEVILRGLVGNYTEMKPLDAETHLSMQMFAMRDVATPAKNNKYFSEEMLKNALKDKNKYYITAAYLFCNWRVWATHKQNEDLAREYQEITDYIDNHVFDAWHGTQELMYFIRETD